MLHLQSILQKGKHELDHKAYRNRLRLFMGRSVYHSSYGKLHRHLPDASASDPGRNLLHHPHPDSSNPPVPGYDPALKEKKETPDSLSSLQTLIISTATRVGMGNLVGVVAAVSLGGAGAVFWMWITALLGASTAFVEAVLAQKYKEPDLLYGGYHGGPAYYIHHFVEEKRNKTPQHSLLPACLPSPALSAGAASARSSVTP